MGICIDKEYPGGNIEVLREDEGGFVLKQELRDTEGDWFYWNFRVRGAAGKTVSFRFLSDVMGYWGPGVSNDGIRWQYRPERGAHDHRSFTYKFDPDENETYFSMALPYQLSRFRLFADGIKAAYGDIIRESVLDVTPEGRKVPLIVADNGAGRDITLSCRHHCCESVASYVLEGCFGYMLSHRDDFGRFNIHMLPFVDLDGAENGDQGKNRRPHDHNRDYIDRPVYSVIRRWKEYLAGLHVSAFCDFHDPWLYGYDHDYSSLVINAARVADTERFSRIFRDVTRERAGGIPHTAEHDIYPGQDFNKGDGRKRSASSYGADIGAEHVFSLETPYFGRDFTVTEKGLREYGEDFARSLAILLGKDGHIFLWTL